MQHFRFLLVLVTILSGCSTNEITLPEPQPSPIIPLEACTDGFAGIYPCSGYDLLAHIPLGDLGDTGISGNDCWGWTDPTNQKEYALMGLSSGTAFIDISDPLHPVITGFLPTATTNSIWRDVKVYNNHAFIVSEASNHGMQVFDLTRLRAVASPPETFTADAHYTEFGNAHNIIINESEAYAYAVGTTTYNGGAHFIDISDPLNPVAAGGYAAGNYSHDAQVVTYNGPDTDYTGKEILIGSNQNEIVLVDITDKANPVQISTVDYNNIAYTHQGWFTEDMRYFIVGDELDERNFGNQTRALVFDFIDLDNPVYHMDYLGPSAAIDHNGYVKGNTYFQANYTGGVRMIDVENIVSHAMTEVGFFDTYPANNNTSFDGVWNVYPYFESENIIISDINTGFYIIRKSE